MIAAMIIAVAAETALVVYFVSHLLTGRTNNLLLGTVMGAEFMILALILIFYIRESLIPQEIVEDRDEGLLW